MTTGSGRICPSCGAPSDPSEQFCGLCGKALDVESFLGICQTNPDKALLRISEAHKIAPGLMDRFAVLLAFRFVALAQKTFNDCESKGSVSDAQVRNRCEECLREYVRAREAATTYGETGILTEIKPHLCKVVAIIGKYSPDRARQLLGRYADDVGTAPKAVEHKSAPVIRGFETLGELIEAKQLFPSYAYQVITKKDQYQLSVNAPFPIRSALVELDEEYGNNFASFEEEQSVREGKGGRYWEKVAVTFFDSPGKKGQSHYVVFVKDWRSDRSDEIVDRSMYGQWIPFSKQEYKRFKATEKSLARHGCFIATAVFGDIDAPEVVALRVFRNEYLCRNRLGRVAVRLYYRISPGIAEQLKRSPRACAIIKAFLRLLVCKFSNPDT